VGDQSKRARGRWGEDRACAHLSRLGYFVVARNWRSPEPHVRGELDVIAVRGDLLVFCEVKARRGAGFGGAAAAVDDAKRAQVRMLAESWIRRAGLDFDDVRFDDVRFDVIAIDGVRLTHHEAAF
jgi:putative endonuclease